MNILLLYATNSGSTEMAANEVMNHLSSASHQVTLKKIIEANNDDIQNAHLVVLGSPSWDHENKEGQPHDDFFSWKEHVDTSKFANKPVAIFGCGDSSYQIFCGAVDELTKWVSEWGAKPVVEPLKMDKYYYQLAQNQELIRQWVSQFPASV
jgi:flavodoxin I